MKIDFWRFMGVVWGMAIVSEILWSLTYPLAAVSIPFFIAKDIVLTVVITFVFLRYYFKKAPETPSFEHGAQLGLAICVLGFIVGFMSSFAAAVVGLPPIELPNANLPTWYLPFTVLLAALTIASAAFTGWYLKKQ